MPRNIRSASRRKTSRKRSSKTSRKRSSKTSRKRSSNSRRKTSRKRGSNSRRKTSRKRSSKTSRKRSSKTSRRKTSRKRSSQEQIRRVPVGIAQEPVLKVRNIPRVPIGIIQEPVPKVKSESSIPAPFVYNAPTDQPGLIIGNKIISSISGPINMYILKPDISMVKNEKAPIFMLFGDYHHSSANECDSCVCSRANSGCCYPVYSKEFLQLLDGEASDPMYPIDFYMESPQYTMGVVKTEAEYIEDQKDAIYPLRKLREGIRICYSRAAKETAPELYNKLCPTRNIRWQNADARQSLTRRSFDSLLFYIINILVASIEGDKDKAMYQLDYILLKKSPEQISSYLDTLAYMFEPDFYKYIKNTSTMAYKQIEKMDKSKYNKWKGWIDAYYQYSYDVNIKSSITPDDIGKFKVLLYRILHVISNSVAHPENAGKMIDNLIERISLDVDIYQRFLDIIVTMGTVHLDLYFLARSFKKPQGSERPFLSIGYFGDNHCTHIKHFLLNIMGGYSDFYTFNTGNIEYDSSKQPNRCIKIDKRVDLHKLMDEYKRL